mgnify:CR=1 FL=1
MKWSDIPRLTDCNDSGPQYSLKEFVEHIGKEVTEWGLVLNPDFQRGHVWTEEQQVAFVEFMLMGGKSANVVYFNAPDWPSTYNDGTYVCVDGLQRITALQRFINNEIKVFGHYFDEFEGRLSITRCSMEIRVNNLKTREQVIQWYLEMNTGGTPHSKEEIDRVKELLKQAKQEEN